MQFQDKCDLVHTASEAKRAKTPIPSVSATYCLHYNLHWINNCCYRVNTVKTIAETAYLLIIMCNAIK